MTYTFKERIKNELKVLRCNYLKFLGFCFFNFYILCFPSKNFPFYMAKQIDDNKIRDLINTRTPLVKTNIQDYPQMLLWPNAFIFLFFFPMIFSKFHRNNIYGFANFIIVLMSFAVVFVIRIVCFSLTIFPDPSYVCQHTDLPRPQNVYGIDEYIFDFGDRVGVDFVRLIISRNIFQIIQPQLL